jgi:hypothetical protein
MDLMEWLFILAVIDGPVLALVYFIWRRWEDYQEFW